MGTQAESMRQHLKVQDSSTCTMKGLSKTLTASSLSTVIFIYMQQPDKFYITAQPTTTSLTCGEHLSNAFLDSLTYMAAICLNDAGIMHFIPAFVRETTARLGHQNQSLL
jgi:phospholipase C